MSLRNSDPAYVYLIENVETGAVKVGISARPLWRARQLRGQHSSPMRLLAASMGLGDWKHRRLERGLHAVFADTRIRGEWFRPSPLLERLAMLHVEAEMSVHGLSDRDAAVLRAFHNGRALIERQERRTS